MTAPAKPKRRSRAICTPVVQIDHPAYSAPAFISSCTRCNWIYINTMKSDVAWMRSLHSHDHTRRDTA